MERFAAVQLVIPKPALPGEESARLPAAQQQISRAKNTALRNEQSLAVALSEKLFEAKFPARNRSWYCSAIFYKTSS
jgi:hypothetical protein